MFIIFAVSAHCTRCSSSIPQEQIERDEVIRFQGRIFCPICAEKLRMANAVACPRCQTRDLPLFDGTTALCRRCGADIPHAHGNGEPKTLSPAPATSHSAGLFWILSAGAAGLALGILGWQFVLKSGNSQPPSLASSPARSAESPLREVKDEMAALKTQIETLRAEWDAQIRTVEQDRRAAEAMGSEARRALAARLDLLQEQLSAFQRRSEAIEAKLSRETAATPARPPLGRPEAPAAPSQEEKDEKEARQTFQEIQARRGALLEARDHAGALAELSRFPGHLASTQAGRELSKLADWERRNIVKNLFPIEKDRAEAHVVKGEIPQALLAYREVERRLGIPELLPQIRGRINDLETLRKPPAKTPSPIPPTTSPPTSEETMRGWLEDFRSIPKASATIDRFVGAGPAAIGVLLAALDHQAPEVRRGAAMALAQMKAASAASALAARLADPDPWNRQVFVTALGELGDLSVAAPLIDLLAGSDVPLARAAHEALERLSGRKASLPFSDNRADRAALVLFWKGWLESARKK